MIVIMKILSLMNYGTLLYIHTLYSTANSILPSSEYHLSIELKHEYIFDTNIIMVALLLMGESGFTLSSFFPSVLIFL